MHETVPEQDALPWAPQAVGVQKDQCVVQLLPQPAGLQTPLELVYEQEAVQAPVVLVQLFVEFVVLMKNCARLKLAVTFKSTSFEFE